MRLLVEEKLESACGRGGGSSAAASADFGGGSLSITCSDGWTFTASSSAASSAFVGDDGGGGESSSCPAASGVLQLRSSGGKQDPLVEVYAKTVRRGKIWGFRESQPWCVRFYTTAKQLNISTQDDLVVDGVGRVHAATVETSEVVPDATAKVSVKWTAGVPINNNDVDAMVVRAAVAFAPHDTDKNSDVVGWRVETIAVIPSARATWVQQTQSKQKQTIAHEDIESIVLEQQHNTWGIPSMRRLAAAQLLVAALVVVIWLTPLDFAGKIALAVVAALIVAGAVLWIPTLDSTEQKSCRRFFFNGWQSFSFAGSLPLVAGAERATETRMPWILSGPFHDGARPPPRLDAVGAWLLRYVETPLYGAFGPVARQWRGWMHSHMFAAVTPNVHPDAKSSTTSSMPALVYGFLSQKQHYGLASAATDGTDAVALFADGDGAMIPCGAYASSSSFGVLATDWAILHAHQVKESQGPQQPFAVYTRAVATHARARRSAKLPPTGWCSWYEMMCDVSEEGVLENARRLKETVEDLIDVVQLDDGYARRWGDWGSPETKKFPHGIEALSRRLRLELGYGAGLWMAPFTADTDAGITRAHPKFFTRRVGKADVRAFRSSSLDETTSNGDAFKSPKSRKHDEVRQHVPLRGFANSALTHPGKFFLGFDLTNEKALAYASHCVSGAVAAGYRFLKLDFLHAGALPGTRRDNTVTRAAAMANALASMRTEAEREGDDVYIVGCSCPLGSAVGWADALRISADASTRWLPGPFPLPANDKTNLPAMRNVVRNVCSRAMLHRVWFTNNPDCLVLRAEGSSADMSEATIKACVSLVVMSGGLVFLSDDVTKLPSDRFRYALKALPALGAAPAPSCGSWSGELTAIDVLTNEMPETLVRRATISTCRCNGTAATTLEQAPYTLVLLAHWCDVPAARERSVKLDDILAPSDVALGGDDAVAHVVDLWDGTYHEIGRDASTGRWAERLRAPRVARRSASLLAVHVAPRGLPRFLGSDMHASGGAVELQRFTYTRGIQNNSVVSRGAPSSPTARPPGAVRWSACAVLSLGREDFGRVLLHLPGSRSPPRVSGDASLPESACHRIGKCAWSVPVRVRASGTSWLMLEW